MATNSLSMPWRFKVRVSVTCNTLLGVLALTLSVGRCYRTPNLLSAPSLIAPVCHFLHVVPACYFLLRVLMLLLLVVQLGTVLYIWSSLPPVLALRHLPSYESLLFETCFFYVFDILNPFLRYIYPSVVRILFIQLNKLLFLLIIRSIIYYFLLNWITQIL